MTIVKPQHKNFYIGRGPNIYHRYGDVGPHIYVVLGTGFPILYSYDDPIHIGKGPQIYEGFPIDMGMGSPYLCRFGDGVPKSI